MSGHSKEFVERSSRLDAENRRLEQQLERLRQQMAGEKERRDKARAAAASSSDGAPLQPSISRRHRDMAPIRAGTAEGKTRGSSRGSKSRGEGAASSAKETAADDISTLAIGGYRPQPPTAPAVRKKKRRPVPSTTTTAAKAPAAQPLDAQRAELLARLKAVEEEEQRVRARQARLERFEREVGSLSESGNTGVASTTSASASASASAAAAVNTSESGENTSFGGEGPGSPPVPIGNKSAGESIEIRPMWEMPAEDELNELYGEEKETGNGGASLLDGPAFDEEKAAMEFKAALAAWRGEEPPKPAEAKTVSASVSAAASAVASAETSTGTDSSPGKALPRTARPKSARNYLSQMLEKEHHAKLSEAHQASVAERRRAEAAKEREEKIRQMRLETERKIREMEEAAAREEAEELAKIRAEAEASDQGSYEYYSSDEGERQDEGTGGSTADDGGHPLGIDLADFLRDIGDDEDGLCGGDGDGDEELQIAEMVSRAMSVAESVVYGDLDDPISPRSRPGSARPLSARPGSRASARHAV